MIKGTKFADNVNVSTLVGFDGGYNGGAANDTIQGGWYNDTLYGGSGNDVVVGDYGTDFLKGDTGNDILFGGGLDDTVYGGEGNDFASGDSGDDRVFGGKGDDTLAGSWGSDTVRGGSGNDSITGDGPYGNTSNDLYDALYGNSGDDTLSGGADDDLLVGGTGTDVMTGGAGADLFLWKLNDVRSALTADTITDLGSNDVLDLSLVLKYVAGDKAAAIRFDETADGTTLEARVGVDKSFVDVVFLQGAHELSLSAMIADGDILLA